MKTNSTNSKLARSDCVGVREYIWDLLWVCPRASASGTGTGMRSEYNIISSFGHASLVPSVAGKLHSKQFTLSNDGC